MATARDKRIALYNKIITKNKTKFKAGKSLSRKDFVALFGIQNIAHKGPYAKVHRANLRLVQAQNEINTLMQENGLYLSSKNYYSEFYVRDKDYTKAVIERMSDTVDTFDVKTQRILGAMENRVTAGTWGTYNKVTAKTNSNLNPVPGQKGRAGAVQKRLDVL